MVDNKEASNEIMKPSNGSSGLLYRVRMQAKKMVDIYAKVWNSFYGDKYYKQMLMLSVDMRKDRIPNILLDRLNGVMSVRFRLSVNEANYEAWKKASHELISTANVSFRLGEVEDYQGFLIGGRNYIFNAIEKSAIEQWKKVDNNRYIASLTARIQFLDTNKNVMWDDFVSVEEIRRPCWCYGSEWHYPSPLHELNRLRELPASRFDWRRGASDDVAVEDGGIWIRYSGLTEQQINSLTEIRCEILDEKDMQSIHEQKEKERQERKQKANEEFKERYAGKRYLVINLSAGPNAFHYPIETIDAIPVGGWTDEYKTTKLVLSLVPAGSFMMGSPENELGRNSSENLHQVTLTKDFHMGVFEVTQKQWELVMGNNPSRIKSESHPVEKVSYADIRGSEMGAKWPQSSDVDDASFLGRLRRKTGLEGLDLPTEAQWEYACRAGTSTAFNNGKDITDRKICPNLFDVGRYIGNASDGIGKPIEHTKVGSYTPNAWGFYDMHGNVLEWCLDWHGKYSDDMTNPVGSTSGDKRVYRGGSGIRPAEDCRSASRDFFIGWGAEPSVGFRLVCFGS